MSVAIVGGGLAAATLAAELRERGYAGDVSIFSEELPLPYERPGLSKGVLLGKQELDDLTVHDSAWYSENKVTLRNGDRVSKIDPQAHTLQAEGEEYRWDKLVLATGAAARVLPEAADSGRPVFYLRTIDHSLKLRAALEDRPNVGIVGSGWIGLEVAAAARAHGCDVTIYAAEGLPLQHIMGNRIGQAFLDLHEAHGVKFLLDHLAKADELARHDIVVCGIGVEPRTSLALTAGLEVDHGVLVDSTLTTSHRDIFAIGDLANHDHPVIGHRINIQHWDNAIQQGKHVAANIVDTPKPYERQPYFFSDQYDLGMEYFGHAGPEDIEDVTIEGDLHGAFRAWWTRDGKVVAAMQANDWDSSKAVRASVGQPLATVAH